MEEQEVVTRMESKILSIESKKRMSTEENKFTPSTIGNIEFSIPLYQRLFEWEEAQIKQLLFDLNESFKLNKEKPYYIGMLTVFVESDTKKYSLVDGQQRFTVLTLMALAFRKSGWRKFLKTDEEKNISRLEITIHEGKNRQVRKMCEAIGHSVLALHRSKIAGIGVKDIPLRKMEIFK